MEADDCREQQFMKVTNPERGWLVLRRVAGKRTTQHSTKGKWAVWGSHAEILLRMSAWT